MIVADITISASKLLTYNAAYLLSFFPSYSHFTVNRYKRGYEMQYFVLIFPFIFFLEVTLKCKEY